MAIDSGTTERRSRRTILAGALGGVAGLIAGRFGTPDSAKAASGDPLILGSLANNSGVTGTKLSTNGTDVGLYVQQNGTGTALRGVANNGIAGFFTSSNGSGVSGVVAANNKYGIYGGNDAATFGGGAAIRASGQQNHGLVATTTSAQAHAVRGINTNLSGGGPGSGVYGQGLFGVFGRGSGVGVSGESDPGAGVFGKSTSGTGVAGESYSGIALRGTSVFNDAVLGYNFNTAFKAAIAGANSNSAGWAGYFEGNVRITGLLNPASAVSAIDHPLDPANKTLAHAFVGSPEMKNVYDGAVTLDAHGQATVTLPSYFEALNTNIRYQLTAIGAAAPDLHVAAKVSNNRFRIAGGQPSMEVSWLVTGVRQDAYAKANPIAVEARKPAARRGRYLNPLAHGQPESKGWKDLSTRPEPPEMPARP